MNHVNKTGTTFGNFGPCGVCVRFLIMVHGFVAGKGLTPIIAIAVLNAAID